MSNKILYLNVIFANFYLFYSYPFYSLLYKYVHISLNRVLVSIKTIIIFKMCAYLFRLLFSLYNIRNSNHDYLKWLFEIMQERGNIILENMVNFKFEILRYYFYNIIFQLIVSIIVFWINISYVFVSIIFTKNIKFSNNIFFTRYTLFEWSFSVVCIWNVSTVNATLYAYHLQKSF